MIRRRPGLTSLLTLALVSATAGGCATIRTDLPPRGDLPAEVSRAGAREKAVQPSPLAVLIGQYELSAIDPATEAELWRKGVTAMGAPAANAAFVYVPVRGQRILALDRRSGDRRWQATYDGEAVTGIAAGREVVVVASTSGRRAFLRGLDADSGALLWSRDTEGELGVPAVVHRTVVVPLDGQLLALRGMTGRAVARADMPFPAHHWHTVERRDEALVVGGEDGWIDVRRPRAAPRRFAGTHGPIYRTLARMDPGADDGGRVQWWTPVPQDGGPPSFGVLMARRAVMGVDLDAQGHPVAVRWVHIAPAEDEHVAMEVSVGRVNLVRESGTLVALSVLDGRMFAHREGDLPTRGAALFDHDQFEALGDRRYRDDDVGAVERIYLEPPVALDERLESLLADADPRLWPAQALAVEMATRSEDINQLALAMSLVRGELRPDNERATLDLRRLATEELAARDHGGVDGELGDPIEGPTATENLALLARRAADNDDVTAVDELAGHLLHPNTAPSDLGEVARALCTLRAPAGTAALSEFVRLYHADGQAALESDALVVALECLSEMQAEDEVARATLALVADDPFTDPSLREHLDGARPELAAAAPPPSDVEVLADGPESATTLDDARRDAPTRRVDRPTLPTLPTLPAASTQPVPED